jgi:hypothetical protein
MKQLCMGTAVLIAALVVAPVLGCAQDVDSGNLRSASQHQGRVIGGVGASDALAASNARATGALAIDLKFAF